MEETHRIAAQSYASQDRKRGERDHHPFHGRSQWGNMHRPSTREASVLSLVNAVAGGIAGDAHPAWSIVGDSANRTSRISVAGFPAAGFATKVPFTPSSNRFGR